jgi:hypothetical protein
MAKPASTAQVQGQLQAELQGQQQAWFTYANMKGFFLQDEANTNPAKVGFVCSPPSCCAADITRHCESLLILCVG